MNINWTQIHKKYKGLWVAFKDDEKTVVGKGKTAKEALSDAQNKGYQKPILTFMPEKLVTFAG